MSASNLSPEKKSDLNCAMNGSLTEAYFPINSFILLLEIDHVCRSPPRNELKID